MTQLGYPGGTQTANQLNEAVVALKQGVKAFEVTMLVPDTANTIPKQHFNEMRALMKMSGVKPSVHGPLLDPAGFGEKGWGGEEARKDNEDHMFATLEKAHMLDPQGNVPVVFHASQGLGGREYRRAKKDDIISVNGEEKLAKEGDLLIQKGIMINKDNGQMAPLERTYQYSPSQPESLDEKGKLFSAEDSVHSANETEWEKFFKTSRRNVSSNKIRSRTCPTKRKISECDY